MLRRQPRTGKGHHELVSLGQCPATDYGNRESHPRCWRSTAWDFHLTAAPGFTEDMARDVWDASSVGWAGLRGLGEALPFGEFQE